MQHYCHSLTQYKRLPTRQVTIGNLLLGSQHPIRIQTMTTKDTMDTAATVAEAIRCIEAGAELIRITAPSKKEAENLLHIKNELQKRGYTTPIVADIHFTPNAAEIAARIVEKVRINPGNYVDKKKFEFIEYTNADYNQEIDRIRQKFTPLIHICKQYGTAMRIGTNHGSLSDRIMSRYGDTPMGMVESAMEFLRIARSENYHQIVLSMKSSNPQVMVQAYRLLVQTMWNELGEIYPLHLGVTEAGDGEDGRIKSAVGIGTLLQDGLGDTIRVSLTEDPELEIPVCKTIIKNCESSITNTQLPITNYPLPYSPFTYKRRETFTINNIGGRHVPVVVADLSKLENITQKSLETIGYTYDEASDKWNISDMAADYIFTGHQLLSFDLPGTLKIIVYPDTWQQAKDKTKYFPIFSAKSFAEATLKSDSINFVMIDCFSDATSVNDFTDIDYISSFLHSDNIVLCLSSMNKHAMIAVRRMFIELESRYIKNPVILMCDSNGQTADEHLIYYATACGALLLDGFGDGVCLGMSGESYKLQAVSYAQDNDNINVSGRQYLNHKNVEQFINQTAFGILQATRTRISKTEYISCPSCGRTLFDLQETTAKIRAVTHHLKGVKIAIMGCIVNGPGEMADADFGYVGSGVGKITLYKGKEVVKRNVDSNIAVDELINLLKESEVWVEK
ncbi:MAG TPA: (E)-4-hydroxy-3-methylbut-2-enyl-diphosphate synthase [Chitinophagaceae bacterium]|nr:(E)-4-hydroxy-3-methylbut-2-enyl-diphosphate synthase [Chitinophagaceae bacterium]